MQHVKLFEDFIQDAKHPKIAHYYDYGVRQDTASLWSNFFRQYLGIEPRELTSDEFTYQTIKEYDLILVPGGMGYRENLSMTEAGKDGLRKYVDLGGRVMGICGGAILLSQCYDWSMGLIPLGHSQGMHEQIADKTVYIDFSFTDAGKEVFSTELEKTNLYFHWGPVMEVEGNCKVLMNFVDDVPHTAEVGSFAPGKVAAGYAPYGNGHVMVISPHIEKTPQMQYLLSNAINYMLRK